MATTKQRQQAAKLARKQNKQQSKVGALKNKLDQQMSALYNKVAFVESTPTTCYDMFLAWREDYALAGDRPGKVSKTWALQAEHRKAMGQYIWVEVMYEDQVAGFISMELLHSGWEVEISYIKPEFRGLGLSSVAYVYAQKQYDCVSVSLSNHRIANKCAYWASLGYKSILPVAEQVASAYGLASVRTDNKGVALTEDAFKAYRSQANAEHTRMLNKVFA